MASHHSTHLLLLLSLVRVVLSTNIHPFPCSNAIKSCNAVLYNHNVLQEDEIASLYGVNTSQIIPINGPSKKDYLVSIPCSCEDIKGTVAYFHGTVYNVRQNDTFYIIWSEFFSGQVWEASAGNTSLIAGENVTIHLLCGCHDSYNMVTYTVQDRDTLKSIADLLSSDVSEILYWNPYLGNNPSFLQAGWVIYVPMEKNSIPAPQPSSSDTPGNLSPPQIPGGPEPDKDSSGPDSSLRPYCVYGYLAIVASIILQWY